MRDYGNLVAVVLGGLFAGRRVGWSTDYSRTRSAVLIEAEDRVVVVWSLLTVLGVRVMCNHVEAKLYPRD